MRGSRDRRAIPTLVVMNAAWSTLCTGNNRIQTASCNECAAHDWYQPLCLGDRDVFSIKHDLKRHAGARQRDRETVNAHYERVSSSQVHPHIQLIFSTSRALIGIATNIEHYHCLCVFPRAAIPCAAALSSTGQRAEPEDDTCACNNSSQVYPHAPIILSQRFARLSL